MEIILNPVEFKHETEMSSYNNNYYRHKKFGYVIYEACKEDYDYQEFYLIEDTKDIFLGCSQDGFSHDGNIRIDFKIYYT